MQCEKKEMHDKVVRRRVLVQKEEGKEQIQTYTQALKLYLLTQLKPNCQYC